jgi:hypothetical protein
MAAHGSPITDPRDRQVRFEPGHRTIEQLSENTTNYRLSLPAAERIGSSKALLYENYSFFM